VNNFLFSNRFFGSPIFLATHFYSCFKFFLLFYLFSSTMNIFVAKLNYETEENDLRELFEGFGEVDSVKIIMDKFTGNSKGFGFVEMSDDGEANNAIRDLNEQEFDGRVIVVKKARPKESSSGGGGGGWSGGSGGGGGGGGNRRY
jgi:RNA recognition motif-containing protein